MDFSSSFGRPIQGISKQPPKVRQEGQCTSQINCTPSVVDGLKTRPSSKFLSLLSPLIKPTSYVHLYQRDSEEAYIVVLNEDNQLPFVYDTKGRAMKVEGTGSYLELGTKTARGRFDVETIGDYTFIVNKEVEVKANTTLSPKPKEQAVVTVAYCAYGRTYAINIDDVEKAKATMPTGETPSDINKVDTTLVATTLETALKKDSTLTVSRVKNFIFVEKKDGSAFKIETRDGAGGADLIPVKGSVDKLDKVPARAPEGMIVSVAQTGGTDSSILYLKAEGTDAGKTIWKETMQGGIKIGFLHETMPHILIRDSVDSDGIATFTFKKADWYDREIGNDESNPLPSFVDEDYPKTISSIGSFQNRLYVTSGENLITTRTDDYFDFFRFTTQKAVDTDPIDIFSDAKNINIINSSATLGGDLVLFSDSAQFLLRGDVPQTKSTATLKIINEYTCRSVVKPISTGENIYFPYDYGRFGGVRELYTESVASTKRARPITEHIDNYIEGSIFSMASSTNINTMFVLSEESKNKMYVYDWLWIGDEKVQSAWHEWKLPETHTVVDCGYIKDVLYIVSIVGEDVVLESIDMSEPLEYNLDFNIKLDRQYVLEFSYDKDLDVWKSPPMQYLPQDMATVEIVLIGADNKLNNGITVDVEVGKDYSLSTNYPLSSDLSRSVPCIIGEKFEVLYEPTQALLRDYQGKVSSLSSPILGVVYFNFENVGHFDVEIEDVFGEITTHNFNNRRMGSSNNIVGFAPLKELVEPVPIRRKADEVTFRLKTNTHIEMQLREIEWTGISNPKWSRR